MTRTINLLILFVALQAADPGGLFARQSWKSVSNDRGVAIYARNVAGHQESEFKGKVTVNLTRVLGPLTGMRDSLGSVNYYDKYGRIIQTISENHKGGINRISFKYKYKNNDLIEESKTEHGISGTTITQTIRGMRPI